MGPPAGWSAVGGAPFNTVAHLTRFVCVAEYVSAVGQDDLGNRAVDEIRRLGVSTSLVQVSDRPTGLVRVTLDAAGVRDYEIVSPAAYEAIVPLEGEALDRVARRPRRVRHPGPALCRTARRHAATGGRRRRSRAAFDVNLRPGRWDPALVSELMTMATVVKLSDDDQATLAGALDLPVSPIERFARAMAARYRLRGVCVTRRTAGATLLL